MKKENLILDKLNKIELLLISNKKSLTIEEAAAYTGYKPGYLHKLCSRGDIEYTKPNGGKNFISKEFLDSWLSKNKSSSKSNVEEEALRRTL